MASLIVDLLTPGDSERITPCCPREHMADSKVVKENSPVITPNCSTFKWLDKMRLPSSASPLPESSQSKFRNTGCSSVE